MKNALFLVLALALLTSCKTKEAVPKIAVTGITVSPATVSLSVKGTQQLTASILPDNATEKKVTWISSNEKKVTVTETGLVTAIARGTAIITATSIVDPAILATIKVMVKTDFSLALGDEQLNIAALDEGNTTIIPNIPRSLANNLNSMKVYITTTFSNAAIKVGNTPFISGHTVDFTNPVTFTIIAGSITQVYTVGIAAYNPGTNPYGIYTGKHLLNTQKEGGSSESYLLMNDINLPPLTTQGAAELVDEDYIKNGFQSLHLATGGKFDGGGHVIKNLICKSTLGWGSLGLFETIQGTVQNLGVETGSTGITSSQATSSAGILAGYVASGAVIRNCYTKGKVSGAGILGGVVGYMEFPCQIENTYSTADVTFSEGAAEGYGGGFVGKAKPGDTGSAKVTNCFATGSLAGDQTKNKLGGFAGENNGSTFTSCYFPKTQPAGGAGLSLPRPADSPATGFKPVAKSSFEGWDYDAQWKWTDGKWPQLRVFSEQGQPGVDLPK